VMVNSEMMKAIKVLLSQPGLGPAQMSVLVGGPDWPTSVLCGILKLPLLKMLLGTSPIIVPIILCVLTGGGMVKSAETEKDPDSIWPALTSIFGITAAVMLSGSGLFFVSALDRFTKEHHQEVTAVPDQEDVAEYERKQAITDRCMKEAIQWEGMNSQMRILLLVSVFFNVCSFYVFCLLGSGACFETIVITTDYRGEPLHGDFLKFIKPFGWAGIALQGASWIVYQLFAVMLAAKATEIQNSGFVSALPTIGQPLESMALQTHAVAWGGQSSTAGRSIARASTLPAPAPMQMQGPVPLGARQQSIVY